MAGQTIGLNISSRLGSARPAALFVASLLAFRSGPRPPTLALTVEPARPVRGSLVRLVARDTANGSRPWSWVEGTAGGEPLHFSPDRAGRFSALAGIPLEGPDSVEVTLRVLYGDGEGDSLTTALFVLQPDYAMERLRVAPKMATPDSTALVRIARETARARDVGTRSHQTPREWVDPFIAPRASRITSVYGTGREFNGKVISRHLGTDFAGTVGEPVLATNRGVVALVEEFYLAGRAVYLDHGEGLVSAYFHLSKTDVIVGDTVARGQVIGEVGRSGRVTGPHLHWVMRYGGVTVDPMSVLALLGDGKSVRREK